MAKDESVKRKTGADLRAQTEAYAAQRAAAAQRPKTDRERLDDYKGVVRQGLRDFVQTGTALGIIAKQNLYREDGYASFEAFVAAEFDLPKTTAYRLIEAARVVTQASQLGTIASTITNQAQALELAPLVKSAKAMKAVLETAQARGPVTADALKAVRVELYPNPKVIDGELASPAIEAPKPSCESCGKPLDEGIVKAAQTRCVQCDPERAHFAVEVGGQCTTCSSIDVTLTPSMESGPDLLRGGAGPEAGDPAPPVGSPVTPEDHQDPSTGEIESPQPSAPPVEASSPSPAVLPDPAGTETGQDVPAPTSPRDDLPVGGPGLDSPAGRPRTPDGPEGSHHVATGQPGQDLSPEDSGDASNAQSSISLTARVEGLGSVGDGLEEGGIPLTPSSSPDLTDPESLVRHLEQFVAGLDHVDADVLGPLLTEQQMTRLNAAVTDFEKFVDLLGRWRSQ